MVTSVEKLKKEIEKRLSKYPKEDFEIEGKSYSMYVFNENKNLNIFEGFLFKEISNKQELKDLLNYRYSPGYTVRIGIYIYNGDLIIKDYLAKKQIRKTISKINKPFLKKFTKALEEPREENISALFDRTDVIEEFYVLYRKSREFLLENIKGISEEEKRKEFIDNFMMQMLTLWYLQEKGFFNNDRKYLINTFKEYKNKGFQSFYEFLNYLFDKISGISDDQYVKDEKIGECVVIGPAIFLNGEEQQRKEIEIPDECFYQEGLTEELINLSPRGSRRTLKESDINFNIPLLNLFESRDWTEGNIDEFVLGAIFEKLMNYGERKQTGAYYTPEEITSYICENTIKPYLLDRINEKFKREFKSIEKAIEEGNQDILEFLFKQLQDIKILDPACGSGHFLEDAIEVLVDIYEKLWQRAKELDLKGKFVIKAANEKGEIQDIDLVEISDEEKFKLLVKFFIILSRNIYGVDINPAAVKVARARLFLTLAKHFKKDKNLFIRFPNVHFNLREGNSLVGYLDLKKENSQKKFQLSLFSKKENTRIVKEKIDNLTEEEKEYIRKISEFLSLEGDIIRELQILNSILAKSNIDWEDFKKVAKTKEKLIKILVVSLNSIYARKLNEIIKKITELFNQKLDEKFSEEFNINLEDLKKIKTFHWIFEFPEVFLEKEGFDVVVGNPPHGNLLTKQEKKYVRVTNQYSKPNNIAGVFLEKAFHLVKLFGRIGYVIPKSIGFYSEWKDIRKLILYSCLLEMILDVGIGFVGVVLEQLGIVLKKIPEKLINTSKENVVDIYVAEPLKTPTPNKNIVYIGSVPLRFMQTHNILIFRSINDIEREILDFISKNSIKFREIYKDAFRGLYIPDEEKEKLEKGDVLWIDKVPYVKRYYITNLQKIKLTNPLWIRKSKFILRPRLFFKVLRGKKIVCFIDEKGSILTTEKLVNVVMPLDSKYDLHALMAIINSPIPSFYIQKMLFSETTETSRVMDDIYVGEIPIPIRIYNQEVLKILVQYLLFLNSTEEKRAIYKHIIKNIEESFLNPLVYELYFRTKFIHDGFDFTLSEDILKHVVPIEYDDWLEYYRKYQVGDLGKEHIEKFEMLETNNLKKIIESYKKLSEDNKLNEKVKLIKSHIWVDTIERWWK